MAHLTPSAPAMGVMPPANIMPPIAIFSTSNPTPTSMHMVGDPLTIAAAMAGTSPLLATNASTGVVPSAGSTAQLPSVPVPVGMFMGDGLIPLPPRLLKKIQAMEFIDMAELMPETCLSETTEEAHYPCCGILTAVRKCNIHRKSQNLWPTSPLSSSATVTLKAWVGCTMIGHSADRLLCQRTLIGLE